MLGTRTINASQHGMGATGKAGKSLALSRRKASAKFPPRGAQYQDRRPWTIPLLVAVSFLAFYAANPTESNPAQRFLFLSYKVPDSAGSPVQYGKGPRDMAFVAFYIIVLTFTREFCMRQVLHPLGRHWCGITTRAKRQRFAEQMYTALYIAFIGPYGLYVIRRTPVWYFNTHGMYKDFPHKFHTADFKAYYLLQTAFWLQQVVVMVLGLEERRKDFKELVAHHIVTVALIALSYRFHFTYVGIAVYITHDISDFFLAVSKSLNYVAHPAQAPTFALCIVMWTYLRHYLNLRILYSMLPGGEFSTVGPYTLDWDAEQYKGPLANSIAFALLTSLQLLNLFWLYCLLRSAYRFAFWGIAKDDRSDVEEENDQSGGRQVHAKQQDNEEHVQDLLLMGKVGDMVPQANRNRHMPKLIQRRGNKA